jgi:hypothetical protein
MDEKGGDEEIWAAVTNNGQHDDKVCLQAAGSHVNNVTHVCGSSRGVRGEGGHQFQRRSRGRGASSPAKTPNAGVEGRDMYFRHVQ